MVTRHLNTGIPNACNRCGRSMEYLNRTFMILKMIADHMRAGRETEDLQCIALRILVAADLLNVVLVALPT
uniref:Uncharacterized protein n=1 Tax=Lutzomyia longipalpis TaxID=7200 RepID=A0A1B0CE64_LUTLO